MYLKTLILIVALSCITTLSCADSADSSLSSGDEGIVTSRVVNESKIYSISAFEEAGLKKPKSLKADAVDKKTGEKITPEATEVHLGFFKSSLGPKDVEVRFYKSHSDALTYGVTTAEKTINTVIAFTNALIEVKSSESATSSAGYGAYVVTGNAIVICQGQIEVCDELIANIK
jgi:hypothetical protein